MSIRVIALVLVIGIGVLGVATWMKSKNQPPAQSQETTPDPGQSGMPGGAAGAPASPESAPALDSGLKWKVPNHWTAQPERPMRFATYSVPGADGGSEGECAVFYFGPGQGGDVDANIDRWVGQFANATVPSRSSKQVHGLPLTRVEVRGTYLAPSGPAMQSSDHKPDYALLGAIVAGQQGYVYFKFTGPSKTVLASRKDFDRMVESVEKK